MSSRDPSAARSPFSAASRRPPDRLRLVRQVSPVGSAPTTSTVSEGEGGGRRRPPGDGGGSGGPRLRGRGPRESTETDEDPRPPDVVPRPRVPGGPAGRTRRVTSARRGVPPRTGEGGVDGEGLVSVGTRGRPGPEDWCAPWWSCRTSEPLSGLWDPPPPPGGRCTPGSRTHPRDRLVQTGVPFPPTNVPFKIHRPSSPRRPTVYRPPRTRLRTCASGVPSGVVVPTRGGCVCV